MNFDEKYPNVFTLFVARFHDSDIEGRTDPEIVEQYVLDYSLSKESLKRIDDTVNELSEYINILTKKFKDKEYEITQKLSQINA